MAVTVPPHLVRQVGLLIGRLHPLGVHHPGTREGSSGRARAGALTYQQHFLCSAQNPFACEVYKDPYK